MNFYSSGLQLYADEANMNSTEIKFGNNADWAIEYYDHGLNFFKPGGTNLGDYKFFIKDDGNVAIKGNVGIGTNAYTETPRNTLDVRGTIRAQSGFVLEGSAGPVYNYWNAVYLDNSAANTTAVLYPQTDAQLLIGKADRRVQVYARQVWSEAYTNTSDERIKENVHTIATPLTKITRLKGVQYDVKKSHISDSAALLRKGKRDTRKDNLGFLAQDLKKVFPELVMEQDSTGLLGINYIGLIPVLVEALKEQQVQVSLQQAQITILQQQVSALSANTTPGKGKLKSSSTDAESASAAPAASAGIVLYQNSPNPFSTSTEISMELPKDVQDAQLTVYNLAGEQRLSIPVADRGAATVRIEAGQLKPGIYIYGIIADGQLATSKQMVVTE